MSTRRAGRSYPPAQLTERGAARQFATDLSFACAAHTLTEIHPATSRRYELTRAVPNGPLAPFGSVHGLDFIYVFGTFATFGISPSADDEALSSAMQRAWASFATSGIAETTPPWPQLPAHLAIDVASQSASAWRGGRCTQLRSLGILRD